MRCVWYVRGRACELPQECSTKSARPRVAAPERAYAWWRVGTSPGLYAAGSDNRAMVLMPNSTCIRVKTSFVNRSNFIVFHPRTKADTTTERPTWADRGCNGACFRRVMDQRKMGTPTAATGGAAWRAPRFSHNPSGVSLNWPATALGHRPGSGSVRSASNLV